MTTPRSNASTDQNFRPTLMGVSSADGTTPVPIEVDPTTGAMLTSGAGGSAGTQYTQGGATVANPTFTAPGYFDASGNPKAITPSTPLPVSQTDGTNTANVLKSDGTAAGQNSLEVAPAYMSVSFTTTTVQAVAATDVGNYRWASVHFTSQGTSSVATFQGSNDNINWVSAVGESASQTSSVTTSTTANITSIPLNFRYFRINVTGISAGTTAGVIVFSTMPTTAHAVGATQSGTWSVGSSSATGSAVPANAFYMGVFSGGTLTGWGVPSADGASAGGSGGVIQELYNGTTFDRQRSATAAANTTGTGLLGVGNLIFDGTNWQVARTGIADGTIATQVLATAANLYNGTNYDRPRSNTTGAVIAAGATTTQTSSTQTTYNASKLAVAINISAFTSGTATFTVNGITSSGYTYPLLASAALGSTGVTILEIFPGAATTANASANHLVPRSINVVVTGTFSLTYGVDYVLSV